MKKMPASLCHTCRRFVIPAQAGISLAIALVFGLTACGDTVENTTINQTGLDVVASEDDLPRCTGDNEGEQVLVKEDGTVRICFEEEWKSLSLDGTDSDFSCKTEELKDKSGLKIVCNGDSIGVVLNGSDGKAGKDGKQGEAGADGKDGKAGTGCTMTEKTDSTVTVVCGDSTMVIELGAGSDAAEPDSERTSISLDSLVGFTQKGPFLKGSTVYLYELSDGRTLKQTNGNFTSKITSDDGRYKFSARDLVSQYAMVVVDGYYRNEVTGAASDAPIRLTALTDMRKRSSVNVNLLTHMEFDRVYNLVTRGDSTGQKLTVKQAKRQAQREILKQFYIELDSNTDAEDMDVFGKTDADAALLAVSILLQGDSNSSALSVLLTEISNDIAAYGEWRDSATKVRIADWAWAAEKNNRLPVFYENVDKWNEKSHVPEFEKYVHNFWHMPFGLGKCNRDGVVSEVKNEQSVFSKTQLRFICKNDIWVEASDIEKDTYNWKPGADGDINIGSVTLTKKYVYDMKLGSWRPATMQEIVLGGGCAESRVGEEGVVNGIWYVCKDRKWNSKNNITLNESQSPSETYWLENSDGYINGEEKFDEARGGWMHITPKDSALGLYGCTTNRNGEIGFGKDGVYYKCDGSDWREAQKIEYETYRQDCTIGKVIHGVVTKSENYYCGEPSAPGETGWILVPVDWSWDVPKEARLNPDIEYGVFTDSRDNQTYRTVQIGNLVWMAENLNYEVNDSWCYKDDPQKCLVTGRFYTWAAAIDSAKLAKENALDCGYQKECDLPAKVQGVCPPGWRLPSWDEWKIFYNAIGSGKALKTQTGWINHEYNGDRGVNGSDSLGLSILPAGYCPYCFDKSNGASSSDNAGRKTFFWSSTDYDAKHATIAVFNYESDGVATGNYEKFDALSVRCVKD